LAPPRDEPSCNEAINAAEKRETLRPGKIAGPLKFKFDLQFGAAFGKLRTKIDFNLIIRNQSVFPHCAAEQAVGLNLISLSS
jgi:hypothetical protein